MRDPNEALVYLARRESRQLGFHAKLMFVVELYSAGARHVAIGNESGSKSDGVTLQLPSSSKMVMAIETVLNDHAELLAAAPKQRGNTVRVHWR